MHKSYCLGIEPDVSTEQWVSSVRSRASDQIRRTRGEAGELSVEPCVTLVPPDSFAKSTLEQMAAVISARYTPFELQFHGLDFSNGPLHVIYASCAESGDAVSRLKTDLSQQTGVPMNGLYVPSIGVMRYVDHSRARAAWDCLRSVEFFVPPHKLHADTLGVYGERTDGGWEVLSRHVLHGALRAA